MVINNLKEKIKNITYYNSKLKADYTFRKSILKINLDKSEMNEIDTIIEITVKG